MKPSTISGSVIVLCQLYFGLVTSLECIKCTWHPGVTNGSDHCVSKPIGEPKDTCKDTGNNNIINVCQTLSKFKVVGKTSYLESVTRGCAVDNLYCNNECDPMVKNTCQLCCNSNDRCNSYPLASNVLPTNLYYNFTGSAVQRSPSTYGLFTNLVFALCCVLY